IVPRAPDKSRTRDFLFLAHALTAVTVHFPQLPYPVAWGQYCRLSSLSMPCASPFEKWTSKTFLDLAGEVWCSLTTGRRVGALRCAPARSPTCPDSCDRHP